MNTTKLIAGIAKTHKLSKAQSSKLVKAVFSTILINVKKGQIVQIAGFGTFKSVKRKARAGRNPQTGAVIKIAAKKYPKFKPGTAFKNAVR
jgi:DNA-binding protein HU-beta